MKALSQVFFLFFFLSMPAVHLAAQTADRAARPAAKSQAEEARERVQTLRVWRLTKALDLDEKMCAIVYPVLSRYDKRRAEAQRSLTTGMAELRKAMAIANKPEPLLRSILDGLERDRRTLQDINQEEWTALKKVFNVEQQAKYVIFQQEFNQEITKMIVNAREKNLEQQGK